MKKTFFSKLLVGAIAIATIGFVSCKDYDDDINRLQDQINKAALADNVKALDEKLTKVSDDTKTALASAESETKKSLENYATTSALEAAIAQVKADAEKAGKDVAAEIQKANDAAAAAATAAGNAQTAADKAQAAADKAQSTADNAAAAASKAADAASKAVADAAQAAADAAAARAAAEGAASAADVAKLQEQLEAQLKTIGELQSQLATANALSEKVKALEQTVAAIAGGAEQTVTYVDVNGETKTGTVQDAMNAAAARVAAYEESIDAIWSAVTSVSLYYNAIQNGINWGGLYQLPTLVFIEGEEKDNVFPANAAVADGQFKFGAFRDNADPDKLPFKVTQEDSLVIRVSPVNAKLQPNQITLINSQGKTLDTDLVKVIDVHPFANDGAPLTRGISETGLWTVVFKLVDGYDADKFAELARYKTQEVVFAVGINNTLDSSADRLVVSEYDVALRTGNFTEAYTFDVNDNAVEGIHNRWIVAEDQTAITNDKVNNPGTYAVELNWLSSTVDNPTPWTSYDENNSVNRNEITGIQTLRSYPQFGLYNYDDNRNVYPILSLAEETIGNEVVYQDIHIKFPKSVVRGGVTYYLPIKGFYVTLDEDFAVESKPSEINAWRSYSYENVGYRKFDGSYVAAHLFHGNEGTIAVKNLNGVKGDIIGFRVYAVNIDGTLCDPDGRAFYVRLGEVVEKKPLAIDVLVLDQYANNDETVEANYYNTEIVEVPAGFFEDDLTWNVGGILNQEWAEGNPAILRSVGGTNVFATPIEETSNKYMYGNNEYVGPKNAASNVLNLTPASIPNSFFNVVFWDSKNENWTRYPDSNTTKVKASINVADEVIDGETYSFKLLGYNQQYQGGNLLYKELLQEITVNIKKIMPASMDGILTVKTNQLGERDGVATEALRVFMKPVSAAPWYYTEWRVAQEANVVYGQDIMPFDLGDIFNGLQTPLKNFVDHRNFRFTFHDSDVDPSDEEKSICTNSTWGFFGTNHNLDNTKYVAFQDKQSYFVPNAYKKFVKDANVNTSVDVNYDLNNVSLKADADGTPLQETYSLTIEHYFDVAYRCALQAEWIKRFDPSNSNTTIKNNASVNKNMTDAKYQITWLKTLPQLNFRDAGLATLNYGQIVKDDGTTADATYEQTVENITSQFTKMAYEGNGFDFDVNNCGQWKIDLNVYFYQYNCADKGTTHLTWDAYLRQAELPQPSVNGWGVLSLADLIINDYVQIDPSSITFKDKNGRADYYQVTDYTNGVITLTNTRSNERPSLIDNVDHTLSFDVIDVFGHRTTVSEKVTMLKPVLIESRRQ